MTDTQLYQPSLDPEDTYERKTYGGNAFYVMGAIGGPVPVMVLGTRNAVWLRVDKRLTWGLLCLGLIALAVEFGISTVGGTGHTVFVWARLGGFGLGALYGQIVQRKALHAKGYFDLSTEKVLVPAIVWMVIGIGVEYGLHLLGQVVAYGHI